ncbi:MAG: AI-2E family transporter [Ignavibacteriales bacterium]|nr:AI-2E family transporter [Ignavibacteriales bacterium]
MFEWLFTTRNGNTTLVVLGLAIPLFGLMLIREFFALIVVSFALTMLLLPAVDYFENKGLKRPLAIVLAFLLFISSIGVALGVAYPVALKQFGKMGEAFGVDRAEPGDSVYVQLHTKRIYEGMLQRYDTTVSILSYETKAPLDWSSFDVQHVVKVGDSVSIKNVNGKTEIGILQSHFLFRSNNVSRAFSSSEEIISRYNLFKERLLRAIKNLKKHLSFLNEADISSFVDSFLFFILDKIQRVLRSIKTVVGSLVIVPMVTFFFLRDYHKALRFIVRSVPNKYFEMSLNLFNRLEMQVGKYIRGIGIEFFLVSLLTFLGYYAFGIHYAVVLGITVGLFNIIPLIGPLLGILPSLIVSITQTGDMSLMIPILIVNGIIQFLDFKEIKPRLYERSLVVHPLIILLLILLGGAVMGVTGTILSVPLYTTLALTARETMWGLSRYQITQV